MLDTTGTANIHPAVTPRTETALALNGEASWNTFVENLDADFRRMTDRVKTLEDEPHFVLGYN